MFRISTWNWTPSLYDWHVFRAIGIPNRSRQSRISLSIYKFILTKRRRRRFLSSLMDGIGRFPRQLNTTTFLEIFGEKIQKARHKSSKQKYTHNYWRRECLGTWSNCQNGWYDVTAETFLYNWSAGEGAISIGLFGRRPLGTRKMCPFALVW